MEKSTWAEDLKPVGVYYEGLVDDATAVVERLTAETVTTLAQGDPGNRNGLISFLGPLPT